MSSEVERGNIPVVVKNYLTVKAAAEYSGYSHQYLRRLLRLGKLTGLKIGQLWLIDKGSLDIYIEQAQNATDQRFGPNQLFIFPASVYECKRSAYPMQLKTWLFHATWWPGIGGPPA